MGYFIVTASGTGVSGNTLPHTGTITFTTRFAETGNGDSDYIYPYIYAIDKNGNEIAQAHPANEYGGSWESGYRFYINQSNTLTGSVTVDVGIFRRKFSSYSNLAGLRFDVSPSVHDLESFRFPFLILDCGAPTSPAVSATISRGTVKLSWGSGSGSANNSVTGYDVEQRESSDGSSWGSWATVSGSPVTGTSLDVTPPGTVGNYYQYRVRTRGSAGSDYYSGWVTSTNTLRRKWDAFGAWTDQTLTAGVSSIRAVHLTQLQERVSAIRAFYGLSAYAFTAVTARKTKIATWAALIGELRSAIDGITTNHAAWNTLEAGKPRIAHITQLRDIIDNM